MKILIGGSSGLLGTALTTVLKASGHRVVPLIRQRGDGIVWDATTYEFERPADLEGFDAVIHLGGENIIGRWTQAKKKRIRDSRVRSTGALADALTGLKQKPGVFIVASAVGYYGDRGAEELTEESPAGSGFLADVVREWEAAADPARKANIRVVHLRSGILLSPAGGALKTMLTPFKLGIGGKLGRGTQYVSWATLDDAVGIILHALKKPSLDGPLNVVSPTPCTNLELTKALGRALRRPTVCPVPAFAARMVFGEMADSLLLASQRVLPTKLLASAYPFRHTDLDTALRDLLS